MVYKIYTFLFVLFTFQGICQINPIIYLRSYPTADTYTEPATISFYAEAYAQNRNIERVEFYLCGILIATTDSAPYNIIIKDLPKGQYCVTATAIDNNDSMVDSYAISYTVDPAPASCNNIAAYLENDGYTAGSKVSNNGHLYECKPWPNSGWCNGASWAYGPGSGNAWTDAWIDLGICAENIPVCENISNYEEGTSYGAGSQVALNGIRYECKPWPYSGWCSGAAWAYAPGQGIYWQDAWTAVDTCMIYNSSYKKEFTKVNVFPHPFEEETTVQLESLEEIVSYELFSSQGLKIFSFTDLYKKEILLGKELSTGYYILHLTTKNTTYTKVLIKR